MEEGGELRQDRKRRTPQKGKKKKFGCYIVYLCDLLKRKARARESGRVSVSLQAKKEQKRG